MVLFYNTIIFVKDIQKSKEFYEKLLGLKIIQEYDTIIFFENHFVIHNADSILTTTFKKQIPGSKTEQGNNNILIYCETDNVDAAYTRIKDSGCEIIHPVEKQQWGQRVFRFYDPDSHIVEIGEPLHLAFENIK
jgi:catechol 2,3-dioxygenase-like lactoylglutathione lyase family enzyme